MLYYPTRYDSKRTGYKFGSYVKEQGLFHTGIDFNYGVGNQDKYQPIMCPTWGIVVYVSPEGTNGGLGNYLVIYHPHNNGYTRYLHNDSVVVKAGETVYPNQIIAYLGDTGTTSAHCHFEVLNEKGLDYIKNYKRPYGRYSGGLTKDQMMQYWIDPEKWLDEQNHYFGMDVAQRLNQVGNALRFAVPPRKNMLERLQERLKIR